MNTYAELTSALKAFIGQQGNAEVESQIPVFVSLGEDDIYRVLRHDRMLKTLSLGTLPFTLPDDFIEAKAFWCGDSTLEYVAPDAIINTNETSTTTTCWSILGGELIFDAPPSGCGELIYYAKPEPLATATNVLFKQNSDLFLFAALAHAMIFLRDESRQQSWASAYQGKLSTLIRSAWDERIPSGQTLSTTYR
jgi:hypothetical protein